MGNSFKKDIIYERIIEIDVTTWTILHVDLNKRYQYQ